MGQETKTEGGENEGQGRTESDPPKDGETGETDDNEENEGEDSEGDEDENEGGEEESDDNEGKDSGKAETKDEGKSRESKKQRRSRLRNDPEVRSMIKAAQDKARREAALEATEAARKKAERESMDEKQRAEAEAAEAKEKAEKAEKRAAEAERNLDFYRAMAGSPHKLKDPSDREYLLGLCASKVEEDDVDWEAALEEVAESKPHLFSKAEQANGAATTTTKTKPKATTTTSKKGNETPAGNKGSEGTPPVDALNMTKEEYRAHKAKLGLR